MQLYPHGAAADLNDTVGEIAVKAQLRDLAMEDVFRAIKGRCSEYDVLRAYDDIKTVADSNAVGHTAG